MLVNKNAFFSFFVKNLFLLLEGNLYGNMVEMSCWIINNSPKVIINMKK